MRILGIDPGLNLTGYGCVEVDDEPRLVEGGVFRLDAKMPMDYRLVQLHDDLDRVIEELHPDLVVVEQLFSHYRHVRTSILMAHARGVILMAARARGIVTEELHPTEIKKAITGHGHATKHQMQQAIMTQCGLSEPPNPPDVADAIAIALCAGRRHFVTSASPLP